MKFLRGLVGESHLDRLEGNRIALEGCELDREKKMMFMDALRGVMLGRRLFLTEKGYLGAGPFSAEVGDTVCIFEGGEVPYVVKAATAKAEPEPEQGIEVELTSKPEGGREKEAEPTSRSEMAWTFIGECYVHGIMGGEALGWKEFKWEEMRLL